MPGRPKKPTTDQMRLIVSKCIEKYRIEAVCIEKAPKCDLGIHIPHNTIHKIMREDCMTFKEPKKSRRRKWNRYERDYSNSMWHTDYKMFPDGRRTMPRKRPTDFRIAQ